MANFAFLKERLICKTTAGIIMVVIFIVPGSVALARCPDCTGEIKRIDATGQCHSCFPCPECIDGYSTSSAPCGATIPYETDIHCVEIQWHPQESSQRSHAIFSSGTVTSTTSLVISASSSLVQAGSSIIQNGESRSTKDPNTKNILPTLGSYSNNTTIYILCGISLAILSVAIVFQFLKKDNGKSQPVKTTADTFASLQDHPSPNQGNRPCSIDVTSIHSVYCHALWSETGDQSPDTLLGLTEGTENMCSDRDEEETQLPGTPSYTHETPMDLCPQTDKDTSYSLGLEKKSMSTSTTGLFNPIATVPQFYDIPQEFRNYFLSKKIATIPSQFYRKICQTLDILRDISWDDFRLLGEKVGVDKVAILWLKQRGNPTEEILQQFESKRENCVGRFKSILEEMGRDDVVTIIERWILFEWQENIKSQTVRF